MMSPQSLYRQTMPFTLARFGLTLLLAVASGVLMLVCLHLEDSLGVSLAYSFSEMAGEDLGEDGPFAVMFCIWLCGTLGLRFLIMHYIGYLLKAAHIAVISEALAGGAVPENQMAFGKRAVLERFGTTHAYVLLDRLVDGAVGQLCKGVSKLGEALEGIPGASAVSGFMQLFLRIALGHVDECCLAFTFHRKSDNAFKDAADSVVLYFQNWTDLLKNSGVLTLVCCALYGVLGIISIIIFAIFMDVDETGMVAAFIAVFFFLVIKMSFIDSWVMIRMITGFFAAAEGQEPAVALYDKLAGLSVKFKDLLGRASPSGEAGLASSR